MNIMSTKDLTFAQAMKKLEEINDWFQHEDIDLDKGLGKLREAKEIIKICKQKLKTVENEFIRIKEEYEDIEESRDTMPGTVRNPAMHRASTDGEITTTVIETRKETIITADTDEIPF